LFILHGITDYKSKVEQLFVKKVKNNIFRTSLIRKSILDHTSALNEIFESLMLIVGYILHRSTGNPHLSKFGRDMYICTFQLFPDNNEKHINEKNKFHRQEVLGYILSHIGSGSEDEVDCALDTLIELVKESYIMVVSVSAILDGILDFIDSSDLSDGQIRKVYTIFVELAYHNPLKKK